MENLQKAIKSSTKEKPELVKLYIYVVGSIVGLVFLFISLAYYEIDRTNRVKKFTEDTSIVKTDILRQVR